MASRFKGNRVNVKKFTVETIQIQTIQSKTPNKPISIQQTEFHSKGNVIANAIDLNFLSIEHILTANHIESHHIGMPIHIDGITIHKQSLTADTIHTNTLFAENIITANSNMRLQMSRGVEPQIHIIRNMASKFLGGFIISDEQSCFTHYRGIANANVYVTLLANIENGAKGCLTVFENDSFQTDFENCICERKIFDETQHLLSLRLFPMLTSSIWKISATNCKIGLWEMIFPDHHQI